MKTRSIVCSLLLGFMPMVAAANYPVYDHAANITLKSINGLSDAQLEMLGRILSENRQQLEALRAINAALGGASPAASPPGGSWSPSTSPGTASPQGSFSPTQFNSGFSSPQMTQTYAPPAGYSPQGPAAPSGTSPQRVVGSVLVGGAGLVNYGANANSIGTIVGGVTGDPQSGGNASQSFSGMNNAASLLQGGANGISVNRITGIAGQIPGLSNVSNGLTSLLPKNDYLNMFMGMSASDFRNAFSSPSSALSSSLMSKVMGDVGRGTGAGPEIMFGARVASMTPNQRDSNRTRLMADTADVLGSRVLANVETSTEQTARFAANTTATQQKGDSADNLNAKLSVSIEQQTIQNEMLIESSKREAVASAASAASASNAAAVSEAQEKRQRIERSLGR